MKLTLIFTRPCVGLIKIETNSEHGNYDRLWVNGEDFTENGDVVEMVREAITQEAYLHAMYSAQYETGGTFYESRNKSQETA